LYGRGPSYQFGPPATPQIVKNLIIANVVVFLAQMISPAVTQYGAVTPYLVWHEQYFWQPFTYMWLHAPGNPFHILFNMFALWMFGSPLALTWGEQRFLRYYLVCGVGAGAVIAILPYVWIWLGFSAALVVPTLGASGAVMGVLLAYSFTWPDRTIMLIFPPIPIKALWLIPLILFMELTSGPGNVSHAGHLGGIVVGWIYLVREGRTPAAPNWKTLQLRYRRWRMRQKLRAVHDEERRRRWDDDDRPRFH
jgi:membrane associated rhomboid family serine protease